jgi:hypothetical protein
LNAPFENEMGHAIVPKEMASFGNTSLQPFNSYGRGSGVEVGVGTTLPNNPDVNQAIIVGLAEQAAAPKTPGGNTFPDNSLTKEGGPINADPLLFASLLKGQAAGNWDPTSCPVANQDPTQPGFPVDANGTTGLNDTRADMAFGHGNVAQLELLNPGSVPPGLKLGDPNSPAVVATTGGLPANRSVSTSKSFVHLVPNPGGTSFSVVSEVHETIAPVTLFRNMPQAMGGIQIEVIGEAILKATASGTGATTKIDYTPPALIKITPPGQPAQSFPFPGNGAPIPSIAIPGLPLINLALGESPRAANQAVANNDSAAAPVGPVVDATNGTLAWGALDLLRITLLAPDPLSHVAEVRLGHMEAQALAPAGGVTCNTVSPPTTPTTAAATTTTTAAGATTTTTQNTPGAATTTTTEPGATTTTTAGTSAGNTTTTSGTSGGQGPQGPQGPPGPAGPQGPAGANGTTGTTAPAQVLGTTFTQSPAAQAQTQQPNFTG